MSIENLKDEQMIDCLGLIDLYFDKNPNEPKDLFLEEHALWQFIQRLLENPSVSKAFPDSVNFLFNDLKYADAISKLNFPEMQVITDEEAGWIVLKLKRPAA